MRGLQSRVLYHIFKVKNSYSKKVLTFGFLACYDTLSWLFFPICDCSQHFLKKIINNKLWPPLSIKFFCFTSQKVSHKSSLYFNGPGSLISKYLGPFFEVEYQIHIPMYILGNTSDIFIILTSTAWLVLTYCCEMCENQGFHRLNTNLAAGITITSRFITEVS